MRTFVPEAWEIPAKIRERFGESAGRQRAMSADGHLLLVVHEPPKPGERSRKARLLWRNPDGVWRWTVNGNERDLLKKHIAGFSERVEQLELELQKAACAGDYFQLLQTVAPLHRTARNLHATLQQARDLVAEDYSIIVARDAASDLERSFELLHMDAKNGLDYTVAQKTEMQSQRSYEMAVSAHKLNILAALFFPITALSAIFGMNLSYGLEAYPSTTIFWGVLGAGLLSGLLLTGIVAQKPLPAPVPQELPRGKNKGKTDTKNLKAKKNSLKQVRA